MNLDEENKPQVENDEEELGLVSNNESVNGPKEEVDENGEKVVSFEGLELDEGDAPLILSEKSEEELLKEKAEDVKNRIDEVEAKAQEDLSIDWDAIEYKDKDKKIPMISQDDRKILLESNILACTEEELLGIIRMMEQMILEKHSEDEPILEHGFTERQQSGRESLAQFQTLARDSLMKIKSKENVIRAIHFQNIRESMSMMIDNRYLGDKKKFNLIDLGKIGFFANFVESMNGPNENDLAKRINKVIYNLFDIDEFQDDYIEALALLKRVYDNIYRTSFVTADKRFTDLKEKTLIFRYLMFHIGLDEKPEINKEDSFSVTDSQSSLSRELDNVASSGMFTRHDIFDKQLIIDATQASYDAREAFIGLFRNEETKEKMKEWLNNLNVYWGNKLRVHQGRSKMTIKELRESFGAYNDEEQEMIAKGIKPSELPYRELSNNFDLFKLFKKQAILFDGCALIGEVVASEYHTNQLRQLFDYIHSLVYHGLYVRFIRDCVYYEPNEDYEKDEEDSDFVDYGVLFESDAGGDATIKDEKKSQQYKDYIKALKTQRKHKNPYARSFTKSSIKNAWLDNINISIALMEAVDTGEGKLEKIQQAMGKDFFDKDSVLTVLFLMLDKKEAFRVINKSMAILSKTLFTELQDKLVNFKIQRKEPIGGDKRKKHMSKKKRKELKEKMNKVRK